VQLIEGLLILEDLSGQGVNPEILFHQTRAAHQAAVGELGDTRSGGSLARHDIGVYQVKFKEGDRENKTYKEAKQVPQAQ
jgi:hypothetical protein